MNKSTPRQREGSASAKQSHRRRLGVLGEDAAVEHLRRAGYRILERNHRTPLGEIDIIAEDRKTLVFVEVRTRKGSSFGTAEESITWRKQQKLRQLAEGYMQTQNQPGTSYRIDVVTIQMGADGRIEHLDLIKNAVEGV